MNLTCLDDDYPQGFTQAKEALRCLTKIVILQPYLFDHAFRSSDLGDGVTEVDFILYVFDIRYQKIHSHSTNENRV